MYVYNIQSATALSDKDTDHFGESVISMLEQSRCSVQRWMSYGSDSSHLKTTTAYVLSLECIPGIGEGLSGHRYLKDRDWPLAM